MKLFVIPALTFFERAEDPCFTIWRREAFSGTFSMISSSGAVSKSFLDCSWWSLLDLPLSWYGDMAGMDWLISVVFLSSMVLDWKLWRGTDRLVSRWDFSVPNWGSFEAKRELNLSVGLLSRFYQDFSAKAWVSWTLVCRSFVSFWRMSIYFSFCNCSTFFSSLYRSRLSQRSFGFSFLPNPNLVSPIRTGDFSFINWLLSVESFWGMSSGWEKIYGA